MPDKLMPVEQVLNTLSGNLRTIAELTAGLTPEQLHSVLNPGEWSLNEILAHLRSCGDVWGGCIATILAEERPVLRAVNPRTWARKTNYDALAFQTSLQAFAAQRSELLAVLEPLPPQDWTRQATVTGAGKTLERSVQFYAQWLASHERSHVKQIARLANVMRHP